MSALKSIPILIFAFSLAIYLFSASIYTDLGTDAALLRIEVVRSLIERHDLSISATFGMKGHDGRAYSWLGIGPVLMAVPFYVFGLAADIPPQYAVSLMNLVFGAATVAGIYIFSVCLGYSRRISLIISMIYCVGTIAWPYAKLPFDHILETFFVLYAFLFLEMYFVGRTRKMLYLSASSIGFAFLVRPTSLLAIPALVAGFVVFNSGIDKSTKEIENGLSGRDALALAAILMPFVALSFWYNHYRFGSIFETGYTTYAKRTGADLFSGTSFMAGLAGLLISPGKGYFYFTPVAVLFFFSYLNFFKRHAAEAVSFLAIILSYILFISKYKYWHGDWGWGPRFIVVVTPFFIIPIAEILSSGYWNKRKIIRTSVFAVVIVSVLIQIAAVSINYKKFFYTLAFDRNVKFQVDAGEGIQPITVPPNEIYYDWRQSQIVSQFRLIAETGQTINQYRFATPDADASFAESIKSQPMMRLYDFWWVYKYFLGGTYLSFVLASLFVLVAVFIFIRLWRLTMDT